MLNRKPKLKISQKRPVEQKVKVNRDTATSESQLQKEIVKKLRAYPCIVVSTDVVGPSLKYIPNNTMRLAFISYSKSRGWEKGQSDLLVVWEGGQATFVELKFDYKTHKGRFSPEQIAFKNKVEMLGCEWQSWRSLDECTDWIKKKLENAVGGTA